MPGSNRARVSFAHSTYPSSTTVTRLVILFSSYFTTSPDGQVLEEMILRLTKPTLVELGLEMSLAISHTSLEGQ